MANPSQLERCKEEGHRIESSGICKWCGTKKVLNRKKYKLYLEGRLPSAPDDVYDYIPPKSKTGSK